MKSNWISCDNRPAETTACLIAYSDGSLDIGAYHAVKDFDGGGFFSSPHEFSGAYRQVRPEYWLPIPFLPIIKSEAA